jgi:uncharacterized protein (TIGR00730 family)
MQSKDPLAHSTGANSTAANPAGYVSISDEEATREVISNVIGGLWEAVNELTRLRPERRERYHVSIFGSARIKPDNPYYGEVRDMARALAEMDCNIITGGGPGMMQAANEGAAQASRGKLDRSVGIRIDLPFEQDANPFVQSAFTHKTFFTRLHHFVLTSDAFIVVPGGIGTVLEAMMVWQLLQVRHVTNTPLIFVGKMWRELVDWGRTYMLSEKGALASPEDFNIPVCVDTTREVIDTIAEYHARWSAAT